MVIRAATREDAGSLLKIYSYYVENTAISFEYVAPSLDEFSKRISSTLEKFYACIADPEVEDEYLTKNSDCFLS